MVAVILEAMQQTQRRHASGTKLGGQGIGGRFAPGQHPMDVEHDALTVEGPFSPDSTAVPPAAPLPPAPSPPKWGDAHDNIAHLTDLEAFTTQEEHQQIAREQTNIADTMAEMWHVLGDQSSSRVQRRLRDLPDAPDEDNRLAPVDVKMAQRLQQSILDAQLTEPCVVYRSVKQSRHRENSDAFLASLRSLEPGNTVRGKGFWSATTEPEILNYFMGYSNTTEAAAVILRIETPVGKFLPSSSDEAAAQEHNFYHEMEVVLPHGAQYEVLDKFALDVSYTRSEKQEATLISLRLIDVDRSEAAMAELAPPAAPNPDGSGGTAHSETDQQTTLEELQSVYDQYQQADLPIGTRTFDLQSYLDGAPVSAWDGPPH